MKTRYSALVILKKNTMEKSERVVKNANADLKSATSALEDSYTFLGEIEKPQQGTMGEFLAARTLLDSQRNIIDHNKSWVKFAQDQLKSAQETLKKDMIEHEKFKHLELLELKKIIKQKKIKESKALDEVALITYGRKK